MQSVLPAWVRIFFFQKCFNIFQFWLLQNKWQNNSVISLWKENPSVYICTHGHPYICTHDQPPLLINGNKWDLVQVFGYLEIWVLRSLGSGWFALSWGPDWFHWGVIEDWRLHWLVPDYVGKTQALTHKARVMRNIICLLICASCGWFQSYGLQQVVYHVLPKETT